MNGKHGQGTHSTKMGADKLAKNTPNAPKFFGPICLPKPKSLGFSEKRSLWVSVVRALIHDTVQCGLTMYTALFSHKNLGISWYNLVHL